MPYSRPLQQTPCVCHVSSLRTSRVRAAELWNRERSIVADSTAFSLFRQYSALHVLANVFRLPVYLLLAIVRAKRMNKRWPWSEHDEYLEWTIEEVREDFNISVLRHS